MINWNNILTNFNNSNQQIILENLFIEFLINILVGIVMYGLSLFLSLIIYKKMISLKNLNFYKKIIINLLIGIVFSCMVPISIQISFIVKTSYLLFIPILMLMLMSFFISMFFMIGAFPIFIISYVFMFNPMLDINQIIFLIIFYAISTFWVFLNRFFFAQRKKFALTTSILMFVLVLVFMFIFFNDKNQLLIFINIIVNFLYFLIAYLIGLFINNFVNNTFILKESIHYDNSYFVNNGYAEIAFNEYIKKNNVKMGCCITFDIINLDSIAIKDGKYATNYVEQMFTKYIYQNLGEQYFFFKTKDNKYALFVGDIDKNFNLKLSLFNNKKNSRTYDDFLKKFEILLNNFPRNIDYNNNIYNIQLVGFCSIYGIQANCFNDLIEFNNYSKLVWTNYKNINVIKLYNPSEKITNNLDNIALKKLKQKYNLKKIDLSLSNKKIFNLKSNELENVSILEIFWIEQLIVSHKTLKEVFYEKSKYDYEILLRYFAYQSLILFNNFKMNNQNIKQKLCIYLPTSYIKNKNFNLILLELNLNKFNIEPKEIIINIDSINKKDFESVLINNLIMLKNKNIYLAAPSKITNDSMLKKYFDYTLNKGV